MRAAEQAGNVWANPVPEVTGGARRYRVARLNTKTRIASADAGCVDCYILVPEAGIEPACLTARDFLTTSAFAAVMHAHGVRGLEHAFTLALRL